MVLYHVDRRTVDAVCCRRFFWSIAIKTRPFYRRAPHSNQYRILYEFKIFKYQ